MNISNKNCIMSGVVMALLIVFIPISFFYTQKRIEEDNIALATRLKEEEEALLLAKTMEEEALEKIYRIGDITSKAGMGEVIDLNLTSEDYIAAANGVSAYGYTHLGIANVENHLNVREAGEEGAKLVGKMSNNAACEVLEKEGDWYHIKSGDVEGYVFSEYLLVGELALRRAESVIVREAESTSGGLRVREKPSTESGIVTTMAEGERLEVLDENLNGWIKVLVDDQEGFISASYAEIKEELNTAMTMTELMYGEGVSDLRVDLCQFAKQFIGNRYVWGGTSLTKGADCSGFTMSVFKNYGISLPHSSRAQAQMGKKISLSEAKPGDLVFYSGGGRINHVAIYIGGGQVVHASNPRTGIRISSATYRTVSTVRRIIQD